MPAVITIPTPQWQQQQQQQQEQEQEQQKKKEEEEQTPKKQYQPLHYDQALLLLKFISSNDNSVSFKSYCDAHTEYLGEKGTDTREKMKNHYQYWKKEGKLPSKYNNPKYPEELVRYVSFKLSLMAKPKSGHSTNSNSKKEKKQQNECVVSRLSLMLADKKFFV